MALLFLLFLTANAVLEINECGCTSSDSATSRENIWQCAVATSSGAFEHFTSYSATEYRLAQARLLNARFSSDQQRFESMRFTSLRLSDGTQTRIAGNAARYAALKYASRRLESNKVATSRISAARLESHRLESQRVNSIRLNSIGKRTDTGVCNCLGNVLSCLQGTSCTSQPVLASLCNWNNGRLFGDCTPCSGLVQSNDGLATASDLLSRFQEFQPSLTAAILQLVPEISSISFSTDTTNSLLASVTLASGVVNSEDAYNQIVYEMAHIFDVYPGTISWSTVPAGKRQANEQVVINFYDEQAPSSFSPTFVPAFVAVLVASLLRLL